MHSKSDVSRKVKVFYNLEQWNIFSANESKKPLNYGLKRQVKVTGGSILVFKRSHYCQQGNKITIYLEAYRKTRIYTIMYLQT
jgi:shikimate kinase